MEQEQGKEIIVQGESAIVPVQKPSLLAKIGEVTSKKPIIPLAVIAGLLVIAILFIVLFAVASSGRRAAEATVAERDEEIIVLNEDAAGKAGEIEQLDDELRAVKAEMKGYKIDAEKLAEIYDFLLRADAGQYSYKFKVDKPIVLIRKGDPRQTVQLTTTYRTSYWFDYSVDGVALVEFDVDRWSGAFAQLNVTPIDVGTTVLTFHNDQNSETFKMMVIVID